MMPRQSLSESTLRTATIGSGGRIAASVVASTRAPAGLCATSNRYFPTRWKRPGSRTCVMPACNSASVGARPAGSDSSIAIATALLAA